MKLSHSILLVAIGLGLPGRLLYAHDMAHMGMAAASPAPAGTLPGGGFALTDQDGRPRTDGNFAGRYRLIYFGFTNCPDECPLDLKKMMAALRALPRDKAGRVAPVFISIDPERDTPAALKTYLSLFPPGLTGLTGTPSQVAKVEQGYKVYAARMKAGVGADYGMAHSSYLYLMGPDGTFVDVLNPHDKANELTAQLAKEIK